MNVLKLKYLDQSLSGVYLYIYLYFQGFESIEPLMCKNWMKQKCSEGCWAKESFGYPFPISFRGTKRVGLSHKGFILYILAELRLAQGISYFTALALIG